MRLAAGAAVTDNGEVKVTINGAQVAFERLFYDAIGQRQHFGGVASFQIGAATVNTIRLKYRTLSNPNGVTIANAHLCVLGAFHLFD